MCAEYHAARLPIRLQQLPNELLAMLLAEAIHQCPEIGRKAEQHLAERAPVPEWAVSAVLLSPDLIPSLLSPLRPRDGAAAAVCKGWLTAWNATAEQRRELRLSPFQLPDLDIGGVHFLTALPGGERLLAQVCGDSGWKVVVLDRELRPLHEVTGLELHAVDNIPDGILASEHGLYAWNSENGQILRYQLHDDGSLTRLAEYTNHALAIEDIVLAPGGSLFASTSTYPDPEHGAPSVLVLDPLTLEYQRGFGADRLLCLCRPSLALSGNELFVLDFVRADEENQRPGHCCLKVFSLAGEYLREMRGSWCRYHEHLVESVFEHVNGRLYIAHYDSKRIHVLTLQGEVLQVYEVPRMREVTCMCVLGKRLLIGAQRPHATPKGPPDLCLLEGP